MAEIDAMVETDDVLVILVGCPNNYKVKHKNYFIHIMYLLVVLITGHIDVGTSPDDILQFTQAVEPSSKLYDPCGQGVHGIYPVLE